MNRTNLTCPACHQRADAGAGIDASSERSTPAIGDVTVCAGCGTILVFVTDSRARRRTVLARATDAQISKLGPETQIALRIAQRAVVRVRKPLVFN